MGKWDIFGSKISVFELCSKVHQIFLELHLMTGNNDWVKVTVLDFKKNSYYVQNWEMGHFWTQNQLFLTFL